MHVIRQLNMRFKTFPGPTGILAAVVLLAVFWALLPARAAQPSPRGKVLHIDARGLDLLLQSDPNLLLIDVRTPGELTGPLGKISRSRNVTMQELEKNPGQFPHDKTLVLICRSGHRSLNAAGLLAGHGYVVYSVDGGMRAWRKLHPEASPPAQEASPKEPRSNTGNALEKGKPSPRDDKGEHPAGKFLDNGMGC